MKYMVVLEKGSGSWGAHVPDLPDCVAVGENREEALKLIREAINFHIEGLKEHRPTLPSNRIRCILAPHLGAPSRPVSGTGS